MVINPYRASGNINVNSELHLAQTRLMTNILLTEDEDNKDKKNNKEILVGKEIDKIEFILDTSKYPITEVFDINLFNKIYEGIYGVSNAIENSDDIPYFEHLGSYILYKIEKICNVYKDYQGINPFHEEKEISEKVLEKLKEDKSHITLKLRQVLNLIRFNLLENKDEDNWNGENGIYRFEIHIDNLIDP